MVSKMVRSLRLLTSRDELPTMLSTSSSAGVISKTLKHCNITDNFHALLYFKTLTCRGYDVVAFVGLPSVPENDGGV